MKVTPVKQLTVQVDMLRETAVENHLIISFTVCFLNPENHALLLLLPDRYIAEAFIHVQTTEGSNEDRFSFTVLDNFYFTHI